MKYSNSLYHIRCCQQYWRVCVACRCWPTLK